jgi:hypothetical protein
LPDAYHKIGYLGSKLLVPVPNPFYGQIPPGTARSGQYIPLGQLFQQQPLWSQITTTGDPIGTANYNAGYVQIEHRFAHGFGFLANYTLSKLMEDCGGIDHSSPGPGAAPYVQAGLGPGDIYSLDIASFRHKAVFNYSFELPFGRGKRFLNNTSEFSGKLLDKLIGGWVAAGVTTFHSGTPLSVIGCNDLWWIAGQATNSGNPERPVFVYPRLQYNNNVSGHAALVGSANYTPYMNRAAFRFAQATPNLLEIGDVPASFAGLISPSFSQWDFSLMKNFNLGKESRYLQFRFEAQNLFNHMNAGKPDQYLTNATFGMITSQSGSPRLAMLAAKFYF